MAVVRWTAPATGDVVRIAAHIAEENPFAARRVAQALLLAGDSLYLFPHRGRLGWRVGTRELVVHPYIIVYRITENLVTILRVWHAAQER